MRSPGFNKMTPGLGVRPVPERTMSHTVNQGINTPESHYLDLLKKCLTRFMFPEKYAPYQGPRRRLKRTLYRLMKQWLASRQLALVRIAFFDPDTRAEGRDWPPEAETMIGLRRLDNLQRCITDVLRQRVPGDLIETGVWRGGASHC